MERAILLSNGTASGWLGGPASWPPAFTVKDCFAFLNLWSGVRRMLLAISTRLDEIQFVV